MDTDRILNFEKNLSNMSEKQVLTGIGARLRSAREAMQLSPKDAASHLHLNPKMIAIMENEDFANGPPSTFIRGYLRSYGKLLKLDEHEIQEYLEKLELTHLPNPFNFAPPIMSTQEANRSSKLIRSMTYLVVIGMIGLVCLWWNSHSREKLKITAEKPLVKHPIASQAITPQTPPPTARLTIPLTETVINNALSLTTLAPVSNHPVLPSSTKSVDAAIAVSSLDDEDDFDSNNENVYTTQRG